MAPGRALGSGYYNLGGFWRTPASSGPFWTWLSGASESSEASVFNGADSFAVGNHPSGRATPSSGNAWYYGGMTQWVDSSGDLWLFGGGLDSVGDLYSGGTMLGEYGTLNDLWEFSAANSQWAWVAGTTGTNGAGTYGTLGTGSTSNVPPARTGGATWIDGSGNLWLMGGMTSQGGGSKYQNDLWEFTPSSSVWTWVSGSSSTNSKGIYGTQGTGSTSNAPGARSKALSWIDSGGTFWLFGGQGYDGTGSLGTLNDFWSFNPSNSQWTWVSGATTRDGAPTYGTQGTGATTNIPGSRTGACGWKDGSGNFWLLGGYGNNASGSGKLLNDLWEYSPSSSQWTWVSGASTLGTGTSYGTKGTGSVANAPGQRAGHLCWKDSSGDFWVFGGDGEANSSVGMLNDLWMFDPSNSDWTWEAGASTAGAAPTYGTQGTASAAATPGTHVGAAGWTDTSGNLWLWGGVAPDSSGQARDNAELWMFTPSTLQWTWMAGQSINSSDQQWGTQGTASSTNTPGPRFTDLGLQPIHWTDSSGNFWLYGGEAPLPATLNGPSDGFLSDLWKYSPSSSQWTWVSGSDTGSQSPVYGTLGLGSASNTPGTRDGSCAWPDSSGNLWLFGGTLGAMSDNYWLNDLWKFTPSSTEWTWVGGTSSTQASGTFGTEGVGSTSNLPPGRSTAGACWTDNSGNFWVFGGLSSYYLANDLWEYTPSNSQWKWVAGSSKTGDGAGGAWGPVGVGSNSYSPSGRYNTATWTDGSGNLWLFGGKGAYSPNGTSVYWTYYLNDLWKFTPSNSEWTFVSGTSSTNSAGVYGTQGVGSASNYPGGRWQANTWIDGSGNLWLQGGFTSLNGSAASIMNDVWKFTPSNSQWTWVAGSSVAGQAGVYGTQGSPAASNLPGARAGAATWQSGGGVWMYGGFGVDASGMALPLNDLWRRK